MRTKYKIWSLCGVALEKMLINLVLLHSLLRRCSMAVGDEYVICLCVTNADRVAATYAGMKYTHSLTVAMAFAGTLTVEHISVPYIMSDR